MIRLTHEQLLGYLLGALECKECEEVEQALAQSPELTAEFEKIRRSLNTMGLLEQPEYEDPPLCLASRTCEYVEQQAESYGADTLLLKAVSAKTLAATAAVETNSESPTPRTKVKLSPVSRSEAGFTSFRRLDLMVAAAIVLVASALSFPALYTSRFQANVAMCQNQLRQLGIALHEYSGLQPDGSFPYVAPSGPRSVAGIYAPTLVSSNLIADNESLFCPGQGTPPAEKRIIPTLAQVDAAPEVILAGLQKKMGGDYGYNMGYSQNDEVLPPRNSRRPNYALMGDAPHDLQPGRGSKNHAGRGQNMLYEDGRVNFIKLANQQDSAIDDPFHNRLGQVAAGTDINDAVLGASQDHPLPLVWRP
ncbi:hypothetical protein NA78x_001916 [Anatilimnocola sp. NA78]|uniref:hypothetical protein n=1 Tax=Anatilimnocola sp. NA78 TaxID=3415683 RepID=UPI003CE4CA36